MTICTKVKSKFKDIKMLKDLFLCDNVSQHTSLCPIF